MGVGQVDCVTDGFNTHPPQRKFVFHHHFLTTKQPSTSIMSSAIATPTGSDAAKSGTATKSDTKTSSAANTVTLSAREEELFKVAMLHCLKSGVPEIDIDQFIEHGKFNAKKTAQNTWATIKNKVFPKKEAVEGEPGDGTCSSHFLY